MPKVLNRKMVSGGKYQKIKKRKRNVRTKKIDSLLKRPSRIEKEACVLPFFFGKITWIVLKSFLFPMSPALLVRATEFDDLRINGTFKPGHIFLKPLCQMLDTVSLRRHQKS